MQLWKTVVRLGIAIPVMVCNKKTLGGLVAKVAACQLSRRLSTREIFVNLGWHGHFRTGFHLPGRCSRHHVRQEVRKDGCLVVRISSDCRRLGRASCWASNTAKSVLAYLPLAHIMELMAGLLWYCWVLSVTDEILDDDGCVSG
jgi:hypothetical protein